jgi:hypothetical protein
MREFAKVSKRARRRAIQGTPSGRPRFGRDRDVASILHPARAGAEGEAAGAEAPVETEGTRRFGEAEFPADFVGPLQPGDTRAAPYDFVGPLQPGIARSSSFHPTITVVDPGVGTTDCGGYTFKVRWGIPASASTVAGWIVQKVEKTFAATDCAGNKVAPKPFDNPAGYPFWEAWEFTAGQNVWVGSAAGGSAHSGDTFSGADYGPGTKGRKTVRGEVKAIVGFALPAGMTCPQQGSRVGAAVHQDRAGAICQHVGRRGPHPDLGVGLLSERNGPEVDDGGHEPVSAGRHEGSRVCALAAGAAPRAWR